MRVTIISWLEHDKDNDNFCNPRVFQGGHVSMREFAGAMFFFYGSGLSKVRFVRGLVCQDSGFKVFQLSDFLRFGVSVFCVYRVLGLQGSGMLGVRFFRGQYFQSSGFFRGHIFQGSSQVFRSQVFMG
jgi:hypothetical protein